MFAKCDQMTIVVWALLNENYLRRRDDCQGSVGLRLKENSKGGSTTWYVTPGAPASGPDDALS